MRRLLLDLTPLRISSAYRRLWAGMSLSGIGTHLTTVAVGLQVYDLTSSTFSVGIVGAFALVPLVVLGLYGGSVVDAHDRRRVVIVTSAGLLIVASAFAAQAWLAIEQVWLLYGLVATQNGLFAINVPARTAIVPRLVPGRLLPAANALNSLSMNIGLAVGPLLAGVLIDHVGYGWTYSIEAMLLAAAVVMLSALPSIPPEGTVTRAGLASVLEGFSYLRTRSNVRMTFVVDLAAMVLAMPRVLFPAIAAVVLGGGSTTVGILMSGFAVGMITAGVLSGPLGRVRRQGLAVVVSVIGWGLAVVAFGVVVSLAPGPAADGGAHWMLWPAAACMALAGAADAVSAVFRMTILQAATPDAMRGRLQGVFIVVVAGGPRLGDLTLGSVGEAAGESTAAVAGGLACVVVVAALAVTQRRFVRYDAEHPTP
ncbi:putative MFS family arabinose efflux permease [Haloactinopolyspora alba]|uniref:Putative MFS family arabinose efflux permease n=1 Tax=Haloactinopolyspora alba TaxID=648780 RepID=A0A2P8EB44_9ACTN|nr:putative MFS family arabinose efflux permease [Haloactinopolyspora alba]